MAGITKTHIQLGDSTTATNNFMLTAQTADGTMKLARGNNGATTQDILTVNADGGIKGIQPAFSAYASVSTSLTNGTNTKITFGTKEFDTANAFDATTNFRFTPLVAGYYQVNGAVMLVATSTQLSASIFKNGASYKQGQFSGSASAGNSIVSALVFLNGTTDYIELYAVQTSGATQTTSTAGLNQTYFQAILLRAA